MKTAIRWSSTPSGSTTRVIDNYRTPRTRQLPRHRKMEEFRPTETRSMSPSTSKIRAFSRRLGGLCTAGGGVQQPYVEYLLCGKPQQPYYRFQTSPPCPQATKQDSNPHRKQSCHPDGVSAPIRDLPPASAQWVSALRDAAHRLARMTLVGQHADYGRRLFWVISRHSGRTS